MLLVVPVTLKNELKVTHGVPVGISSRSNWHTDSKELDIKIKIPILNINDTRQIGNFILKNLNFNNVQI